MPENKKRGQKGKYEYWIKPEGLLLIKGWKMDGLTDKEVAKNIGINPTTLADWKNKYPELAEALKMSAEVADRIIENALFEKAKAGNMAAIIFYLKNRKPDVWREVKATEEETELTKLQGEKLKAEIEALKQKNGSTEDIQLIKIVNDV